MFSTKARLAVAGRAPVSNGSIVAAQGVSRAVGGRNERFATIVAYEGIAKKCPAVASAANFGVAVQLAEGNATQKALTTLEPIIAEKGPLSRAASALRIKCLSSNLEAARSAAVVSGAATEDQVSRFSGEVETALNNFAQVDKSWGTSLASAEFYLSKTGGASAAVAHFARAEDDIGRERSNAGSRAVEPSNAAIVAHLARYEAELAAFESGSKHAVIKGAIDADKAHSEQLKAALSAFKTEVNATNLTNDELIAIAYAIASSETKHHYLDFFSSPDYSIWATDYTVQLMNRIEGFIAPGTTFVSGASNLVSQLESITKPQRAFYGDAKDLKAALASDDILAAIQAKCGPSPQTAHTKSEDSYVATRKLVDGFVSSHPAQGHGSPNLESFTVQLQKDVLEQLSYRAVVGKSVALEQSGKLSEAKEALSGVVKGDRYLHMWKAFLARGRINRALGLVEDADNDFKRLHDLKAPLDVDIPQLDENRYKSAF